MIESLRGLPVLRRVHPRSFQFPYQVSPFPSRSWPPGKQGAPIVLRAVAGGASETREVELQTWLAKKVEKTRCFRMEGRPPFRLAVQNLVVMKQGASSVVEGASPLRRS